jgi:hypothetical protein
VPVRALLGSAVGERDRRDDGEPPSDLAAAGAGEQSLCLDFDAGIDECRGQPFVIFS